MNNLDSDQEKAHHILAVRSLSLHNREKMIQSFIQWSWNSQKMLLAC